MIRPSQRIFLRCAVAALLCLGTPIPACAADAIVARGTLDETVVESGELEAIRQTIVASPPIWRQNPQITALVPEGTRVSAGDFLIQLDDTELRGELALAESRAASLRADLEKIRAQQALEIWERENAIALARFSLEQAELQEKLQEFESEVSKERARLQLRQAELDLARAEEQAASQEIINRAQLAKANVEIRQAENEIAGLQERIALFTIRAAQGGLIVYQEVGGWSSRERLRLGYTPRPGEALLAIPDLSRMQVVLQINEVDWSRIRVGQPARITLEAYPDTTFAGRVREVAKLAQVMYDRGGDQGFNVYVDLLGQDARLKPGMSARVEVIHAEHPDVLIAPINAVFEVAGQPVIFPAEDPRAHAVYLGPRNDRAVVITRGAPEGLRLSTHASAEDARPLGSQAEADKVAEAVAILSESFPVFAERGILYDYESKPRAVRRGRGRRPDAMPDETRRGEGQRGERPRGETPRGERQRGGPPRRGAGHGGR